MSKDTNSLNNASSSGKQQGENNKNNRLRTEKATIFNYLKHNTATASMVAEATGIPQKNICRYKRDLEKAELLWEVENKYCNHTGHRAYYLTTNRDLAEHLNLL